MGVLLYRLQPAPARKGSHSPDKEIDLWVTGAAAQEVDVADLVHLQENVAGQTAPMRMTATRGLRWL